MAEKELELLKADMLALQMVVQSLCILIAQDAVTRDDLTHVLNLLRENSEPSMELLTKQGFSRYEERLKLIMEIVENASK